MQKYPEKYAAAQKNTAGQLVLLNYYRSDHSKMGGVYKTMGAELPVSA